MINLYGYILLFIFVFAWLSLVFFLCNKIGVKNSKRINLKYFVCSKPYRDVTLIGALTYVTLRSFILLKLSDKPFINSISTDYVYNSKAIDLLSKSVKFLYTITTEMQVKKCTPTSFTLSIISVFVFLYIIKYENNYADIKRTVFILSICLCFSLVILPNRFLIVMLCCFIQSTALTVFCSWMLSKMIQLIDTI